MPNLIESINIDSKPPACMEISDPAVLSQIPLVSVKMITYNHAPFISKAIEGVLQQKTNFPIELVIGEDCSTDNTRNIVFEYQKKYPDIIRVITSNKNVGTRYNGIRTMEACRGRYIAICEGDDYWHNKYKLNKQADYINNHPNCGLVYSDYNVYHFEKNKLITDYMKYRKWRIIQNPTILDYLQNPKPRGGNVVGVLTCTVMFRRNLYEQIIESDPFLHKSGHFLMGDTQLWMEMTNISDLHYFEESMATHVITSESATRSNDVRKVLKFDISRTELAVYICNKYNLPLSVKNRYENYLYDLQLRLSCYTRDAELAEKLKNLNIINNYKKWLRYYGAKNVYVYYIYSSLESLKNLFRKKHEEWQ